MTSVYTQNIEVAQRLQERFDYFLAALPFAVLALAVQTNAGLTGRIEAACELLGRGALLCSGFAGLYRLEGLPRLFQISAHKFSNEEQLNVLRRAQTQRTVNVRAAETGAPVDVTARINDLTENIEGFKEVEERMLRGTRLSYRLHKWGLVSGFVLLTVSRSIPQARWLIDTVRGATH